MRLVAATLAGLGLWAGSAQAIVGGKDVPPGEMRAVANVYVSGIFGCTGTLIDRSWVMTAAHCGSLTGVATAGLVPSTVPYPPSQYTVYLDSVHSDGSGGERHDVKQVVVASDYGITSGAGSDVALLELTEPSAVPPIRIAAVGERSAWNPGVFATVAGFGLTAENGEAPERMQQARVPIQSDPYCAQAYPGGGYDPKTMLCAGYPQGGTDTCQGDSGGPLLVDASGTRRLVGATSFGEGCAQEGKPGVYARVAEGPLRAFVGRIVPAALAPEPRPRGGGTQAGGMTAAERRAVARRMALRRCNRLSGRRAKARCRALARCHTRATKRARTRCRAAVRRKYRQRRAA